jgi:hypothetical protein
MLTQQLDHGPAESGVLAPAQRVMQRRPLLLVRGEYVGFESQQL